MNIRVCYQSRGGNTRKLAEAMAAALRVPAENVESAGPAAQADVLFLGGAVYATHDHDLAPSMIRFIEALDPARVGKAVVFSTGFPTSVARASLRKRLAAKGIAVADQDFHCKGKFLFFNWGHPNYQDLDAAGDFARKLAGPH